MQARVLPIFKDISFNSHHIEDYLPMQAFDMEVFDRFCEDGWVYWSDLLFRKNYTDWKGSLCRVVMLRIDLQRFKISKSQRICIRRNSDLKVVLKPLQIRREHVEIFERHSARFGTNRPVSIGGFFSLSSHRMPCFGVEFDFYSANGRLIGASFCHAGKVSLAANYCVYEPDEAYRSLGLYSMLIEIEQARRAGLQYYYPGFVYDTPSEFDYKLNFNGLEYFDWWGCWYPLERLPVRNWRSELLQFD